MVVAVAAVLSNCQKGPYETFARARRSRILDSIDHCRLLSPGAVLSAAAGFPSVCAAGLSRRLRCGPAGYLPRLASASRSASALPQSARAAAGSAQLPRGISRRIRSGLSRRPAAGTLLKLPGRRQQAKGRTVRFAPLKIAVVKNQDLPAGRGSLGSNFAMLMLCARPSLCSSQIP